MESQENFLLKNPEKRFSLILVNEDQHIDTSVELIKFLVESKICYVCLSRPYSNVINDLKQNNIETNKIFFVDVLSSHYEKHKNKENCLFLSGPSNLEIILDGIRKMIKEKGCSIILIDTISHLLIYQENFNILKFTHSLSTGKYEKNLRKIFIFLNQYNLQKEESNSLVEDISMFTDNLIDLRKSNN